MVRGGRPTAGEQYQRRREDGQRASGFGGGPGQGYCPIMRGTTALMFPIRRRVKRNCGAAGREYTSASFVRGTAHRMGRLLGPGLSRP